jgi:hypothetical protein
VRETVLEKLAGKKECRGLAVLGIASVEALV